LIALPLTKYMRKIFLLFFIFMVMLTDPVHARVKKADLAGTWYSGSKKELAVQINSYLDKAEAAEIDGRIIGVISPHAGYIYSGPVAAYTYKSIKNMDIKTVVVVGFSHRMAYDGIAVFNEEAYQTPIGIAGMNTGLVKKLIRRHKKIYSYPAAFKGENSVEMQIPFLQTVLKDSKLVLIAIGEQSRENSQIIAKALYNVLKTESNFILIASTDMSHYLSYNEANRVDKDTISLIKRFDPDKLYTESLLVDHRLMCGYGAICAVMQAAELLGADKLEVLKYANSGDTAGDKQKVVGYLSAVIYKKSPKSEIQDSKKQGEKQMLSENQRKRLLHIARETIKAYIETGKKLKFEENDPTLNREMGAFVTLHHKGQLRGCIGNIIGKGPLYLTVKDMAIQSSTADPRFSEVTASELKDIDIEISVLSELEKIDDPALIEMGKHGVLVRSGFRSGVFLPQVATETGWSREEFMSNLCSHKAGLPPDAWKTGKCDIYVFTAEVFGEK